MHSRRNVLIFHAGALGDFVLTWPLAIALGRLYPQSRVYYVTHSSKAALAEKVLRVDGADLEAGWHALFTDDAPLPDLALKRLAPAHLVFTFLSDGHDVWAGRVRSLAPGAELIPLTQPAMAHTGPLHASEMLQLQLQPWPVVQTALQQILRSIMDRGVGYRRSSEGSIVIHPGSGAAGKNWPAERFIELAGSLNAAGKPVKFVVGEVEIDRWPAELLGRFTAVASVVRSGDYLQLLGALETADVFIGNDSGPGHLAAVIGVPTVTLFGATDPTVWRPLGPKVRVIHQTSMEQITVDDVLEAMR